MAIRQRLGSDRTSTSGRRRARSRSEHHRQRISHAEAASIGHPESGRQAAGASVTGALTLSVGSEPRRRLTARASVRSNAVIEQTFLAQAVRYNSPSAPMFSRN